MVQRYNPDYVMHAARFAPFARENEHGEYVKFSDYEALVSELASSLQINAQTLQVKLTMAETIKELTDRVNALAVENAALKDAITTHSQSTHFCELCGKDDPCSTDDVCYALNETPATDTALAAIQAQGVEKFAKALRVKGDDAFFDAIAEAQANAADEFAAKLRETK